MYSSAIRRASRVVCPLTSNYASAAGPAVTHLFNQTVVPPKPEHRAFPPARLQTQTVSPSTGVRLFNSCVRPGETDCLVERGFYRESLLLWGNHHRRMPDTLSMRELGGLLETLGTAIYPVEDFRAKHPPCAWRRVDPKHVEDERALAWVNLTLLLEGLCVAAMRDPQYDAAVASRLFSSAITRLKWKGYSLNDELHWTNTKPLHSAAQSGCTALVQALIDAGADPNGVDNAERGYTALHVAAKAGHLNIVKALFEGRASINPKAADTQMGLGFTPVMLAVSDPEMVRYFATHGADLNYRANYRGHERTAITEAAFAVDVKGLKSVLEWGGKPRVEDIEEIYTHFLWKIASYSDRPVPADILPPLDRPSVVDDLGKWLKLTQDHARRIACLQLVMGICYFDLLIKRLDILLTCPVRQPPSLEQGAYLEDLTKNFALFAWEKTTSNCNKAQPDEATIDKMYKMLEEVVNLLEGLVSPVETDPQPWLRGRL